MLDPEREFTAMYRDAYPYVLRFVRRRVEADVVDDVVADVFTVAWRRWSSTPEDVRPWLFGIAHRVIAQDRRTRHRRSALQLRVASDLAHRATGQFADSADATLDVQRAWAQLGAKDREAIALVAWDGLTGDQAARVLGITRSAFAVRLSRARRRLRAVMQRDERAGELAEPAPSQPRTPRPLPTTPIAEGELR